MARFYFHLLTPTGRKSDDTGLEFPTLEDAYLQACRTIPAMSAELAHSAANPMMHAFEIADASGRLLMEVPFAEVLDRGGAFARSSGASLRRKARAKAGRTNHLIGSLNEEHAALRTTLAETMRLLALARPKRGWEV